ncbi:MAG: urease accessory UreF family protein [Pseudomonadota bacterium]
MHTDLLALTQWLSPAFPLGSFAYSHGLEQAVAVGDVSSGEGLHDWILTVITQGSGRSDAILLALAHRAELDCATLQAEAQALAASRERWAETIDQGTAFTETTNALFGETEPPMALPVAVGRASRRLSLDTSSVVALYLQAFASNLVQAGVRFIPLGQTEGQKILQALHPPISAVAEAAVSAGLDDIENASFGADLAAMAHETMETRVFRT